MTTGGGGEDAKMLSDVGAVKEIQKIRGLFTVGVVNMDVVKLKVRFQRDVGPGS